ncbi:MAG: hypothetical protein JNK04_13185, partial [Myxococcales bacterium]|nr:hypothetical protein [Myxococcales bacterium]
MALDLVRAGTFDLRRHQRRTAEPGAVPLDEGSAGTCRRKHHVRETQLVHGIAAFAGREETGARDPRVADLRDRDGLADHMGVGRQDDLGACGRLDLREGASVGYRGTRHDFFPLRGASFVVPPLRCLVSATTRSKSLSKSRS